MLLCTSLPAPLTCSGSVQLGHIPIEALPTNLGIPLTCCGSESSWCPATFPALEVAITQLATTAACKENGKCGVRGGQGWAGAWTGCGTMVEAEEVRDWKEFGGIRAG